MTWFVLAVACGESDEIPDAARAGLFQLAPPVTWKVEGGQPGANLGARLAGAGDVNGDGYADITVSVPFMEVAGVEDAGIVQVYLGGATSLSACPAWTAAGIGKSAYLGWSVAEAGDVNADGFDDLVLGMPYHYTDPLRQDGSAQMYLGSAAGLGASPSWEVFSADAIASFGSDVASDGDVDGDGFDDVVVGSSTYDDGEAKEGAVFVYRGSSTGLETLPSWQYESDLPKALLGTSVAYAGDVNGDGFDDVLVGIGGFPSNSNKIPAVLLFMGTAGGLETAPAWSMFGGLEIEPTAPSVASAGDVNADGFDDVVVGLVMGKHVDGGHAYVWYGSASGLAVKADWTVTGDNYVDWLGQSASSAGDVNGDGFDDLVVGAGLADGDQVDEGTVSVYLGSATGLESSPVWVVESDLAGARLGTKVTSAGDTNGDGLDEVLAGAVTWENEGAAFLYGGGPVGVPPDDDDDGVPNACDVCPDVADPDQLDQDADRFGDACDCAPADPLVFPGAAETCNGLDDSCAGLAADERDDDNDGSRPCEGDCDDADPNRHPAAAEVCNGVDDNCDGVPVDDETADLDSDGLSPCEGDCDDSQATVGPDAPELCGNQVDDNCDGATDEEPCDREDTATSDEGCGCRSGPTAGGLPVLLLLLATARRVRRR